MSDERPTNAFPLGVKEAFFDYITADGYRCKERPPPEKYRLYILFLDNLELRPKQGSQFESNCKHQALKNYELRNDDHQGLRLYRQPGGKYKNPRRVLHQNDVFEAIKKIHLQLGHPGRDKVFYEVDQQFYGTNRDEVEWLKAHCLHCLLNAQNKAKAPLTPIVVNYSMERVQIDLIDMRHQPSGQYCWICHIKDHWSKYTQLYALTSKNAGPIANCIAVFIMAFFPPKILQCDNGKEFKGKFWLSYV